MNYAIYIIVLYIYIKKGGNVTWIVKEGFEKKFPPWFYSLYSLWFFMISYLVKKGILTSQFSPSQCSCYN